MMNYFLRTLEGLGDVTGGVVNTFLENYVSRYMNENLLDRHFFAFRDFVNDYPDMVYKSLVNEIIKYVRGLEGQWGQTGWAKLADNMAAWYTQFLRKSRDEQAAQEQAAQYEEAMKERAAAIEAAQEAEESRRRQAEQAQEQAAAAARAYSEAMKARPVDEIAKAQAEAVEQANEIINEVKPMQDITLENQVIESTPTYTIIDETAESITYEDEAGNVHVEPKASAAPWLILAAAAALFLA